MEDRERKPTIAGTDEEQGSDEDVELHRRKFAPSANEEAPSDDSSDDDVELHKKRTVQ